MNRHMRHLVLDVLLALGVALPPATLANDQPKPDAAIQITEITLRRTPCYGPCPVDELVLNADGTAQYTGKMNAMRIGQYKGTFWKGEFEQLARWIGTQEFFAMPDSYGWGNPDGSDQIISAVRGGQRKTVVNHIGNSVAVWGMERAIRGVAADIAWQPELSGIRGIVTWRPKAAPELLRPPSFRAFSKQTVIVRSAGDRQEFMLRTDEAGKFEIALRPGTYSVEVLNYWSDYRTAVNPQQTVVTQRDKFSDVAIKIDRSSDKAKP